MANSASTTTYNPVAHVLSDPGTPKPNALKTTSSGKNSDNDKIMDLRQSIIELNNTLSGTINLSSAQKAAGLLKRIYMIDLPLDLKVNTTAALLTPTAEDKIRRAIRHFQNGGGRRRGLHVTQATVLARDLDFGINNTKIHYSAAHVKDLLSLKHSYHKSKNTADKFLKGEISEKEFSQKMAQERQSREKNIQQRIQNLMRKWPKMSETQRNQAVYELHGLRRSLISIDKKQTELLGKSTNTAYTTEIQADIQSYRQLDTQVTQFMQRKNIPFRARHDIKDIPEPDQEISRQEQEALKAQKREQEAQQSAQPTEQITAPNLPPLTQRLSESSNVALNESDKTIYPHPSAGRC